MEQAGEVKSLSIRKAVIEYGALPIASWLPRTDSLAAIQLLLKQLTDHRMVDEDKRCMVDIVSLARCLDVPLQNAYILVDTLESIADKGHFVIRRQENELEAVDAHAVVLFLFTQLYIRQAQRPDPMDVWPGTVQNAETTSFRDFEPGSPIRQSSSPLRGSGNYSTYFQPQRTTHLARKDLQQHLQQHQHLLHSYTDYLRRHAHMLLPLVLDAQPQGASFVDVTITPLQFDRLRLLLQAADIQLTQSGSPMDTTPPPFVDSALSWMVPLFEGPHGRGPAPILEVADWLSQHIQDDQHVADSMSGSPLASSTRWADLAPAGVSVAAGGAVDIQGVVKSTVVRGQDEFPDGVVRITDCHDTIVYALAPLRYALVSCCTDCTIVLGAVGGMLRIEKCERLQLVATAVRIIVSTCHDCVLQLGVNHAPLLLGDNRFLQVAPYCTQYERLADHMLSAGVLPEPNLWDCSVTLTREHWRASLDTLMSSDEAHPLGGTDVPPPITPLAPEKLVPFMVPFHGGSGPLLGGPSSVGGQRWSADTFVGLADTNLQAVQSPCPFRLPPAYEAAKESRVASVTELRNMIKSAVLEDSKKRDLQRVIQEHFKEWLNTSGNMRQVYDLARLEREEGQLGSSGSGSLFGNVNLDRGGSSPSSF